MITVDDEQILPFDQVGKALAKRVAVVQQVAHADGLFHVFIGIDGADAAASGAELLVRQAVFLQAVQKLMIRHADRRAVGDFEIVRRDLDALFAQATDLADQMLDVDDHADAHDVDRLGAQNTGGQKVQNELAAVVDDGVTRVVAALIADDDVVLTAQKVDHAALAFVTPVDAYNGC